MNLEKFDISDDIYFNKEYISIYLKENDSIFTFDYSVGDYFFKNISIKKPISKIGKVNVSPEYFDLESVYGYGGYITNTSDTSFIQEALDKYSKKCKAEGIISEFIRFHPFNYVHNLIDDFLDFLVLDRNTITVDTSITKEERWKNYSSKVRNILRKCEKNLVLKKTDSIDCFLDMYEKTMDRNNAEEFYYFDREYFEKIISIKNVELYEVLYNNKVISSSFFLFGSKFAHYHLSANDYEYRNLNANYFILDSIFEIAGKRDINYFNLGGGRTSLEDDLLFKFKRKFSSRLDDFYIAGKVFNKEVYNNYNKIWETQSEKDIKYFLKYRLEL